MRFQTLNAMTHGQRTAVITIVAAVIAEALLDIAYHRWPPFSMTLGTGLGASGYLLLIGRKADTYPWWFGVSLAISVSVGIVIARMLFGDSCPL
jgi:hypothetical protein